MVDRHTTAVNYSDLRYTQIVLASMFLDVESHFNNRELPAAPGHLLFIMLFSLRTGTHFASCASDTSGIFPSSIVKQFVCASI